MPLLSGDGTPLPKLTGTLKLKKRTGFFDSFETPDKRLRRIRTLKQSETRQKTRRTLDSVLPALQAAKVRRGLEQRIRTREDKDSSRGLFRDISEERRKRDQKSRKYEPACRVCGRKGDSTRHHFVNRWILKELSNYESIARRSLNTIPVCVRHHRDLHSRGNGGRKSIVKYLNAKEKGFVDESIERLRREHPKILKLLSNGNAFVYEACLIQDWLAGEFDARQR